jgi:hypothetical protein
VLLVDNKGKTSRVRSFSPLEVQVHSRNRHDAPWQRSMQVFIKSATLRSPVQATLLFRRGAPACAAEKVFYPRDVQNNLASVQFGGFFNSAWREYRGKFVPGVLNMKIIPLFTPLVLLACPLLARAQDTPSVPSADEIVARMGARDDQRQLATEGYAGMRNTLWKMKGCRSMPK